MDKTNQQEKLRSLPSVEKIMNEPKITSLLEQVPRRLVVKIVRDYLEKLRQRIVAGEGDDFNITNLLIENIKHKKNPNQTYEINKNKKILKLS